MHETDNPEMQIDFIGLGVPKAGTTWIYGCLSEHPDICTSRIKETNFFLPSSDAEKDQQQWYREQFGHCGNEKKRGEFSVHYFASQVAADAIKKSYPDARLIVSLRNPVEQITSYYLYSRFEHHQTMSMTEAVTQHPDLYSERCKYAEHLEYYYQLFPKEQILVLIYEDMLADPQAFMKRVYEFIGVDATFVAPGTFRRKNVTGTAMERSKFLGRIFFRLRNTITRNHWLAPVHYVIRLLGLNRAGQQFVEWNTMPDEQRVPADRSVVSDSDREYVKNLLASDIAKLEQMLGRPLSEWR